MVLKIAHDAVPLDALSVEVEARNAWLERSGFYERRQLGSGIFIDRAAIERRSQRRTSDILRTVSGVRVTATYDGVDIMMRSAGKTSIVNRNCRPPIYVDGIIVAAPLGDRIDLHAILPGDIEAIEAYSGPAQVPPKYGGAYAACGVVLIWTRK